MTLIDPVLLQGSQFFQEFCNDQQLFHLGSWLSAMVRHKGIVKFGYAREFIAGCESYFISPTAWYYVRSLGQNEVLQYNWYKYKF